MSKTKKAAKREKKRKRKEKRRDKKGEDSTTSNDRRLDTGDLDSDGNSRAMHVHTANADVGANNVPTNEKEGKQSEGAGIREEESDDRCGKRRKNERRGEKRRAKEEKGGKRSKKRPAASSDRADAGGGGDVPVSETTEPTNVDVKGKRDTGRDDDYADPSEIGLGRVVASSNLDFAGEGRDVAAPTAPNKCGVTLLLFYQYVEPQWSPAEYKDALRHVEESGTRHCLTGRMRVAREGLNCTLTGPYDGVRRWCRDLRVHCPRHFAETEFKLTDNLPVGQMFPKLHAFPVEELVHYGLAGERAPPLSKTGTHLEPEEYHEKMAEDDTVVIDVRNHYEAVIGHFSPPDRGAQLVDPKMRKSTEFPLWLDRPETKEKLRGKQVLMYCTGGVRCERASALLRRKMETEEDTKELGIRGVYQLQGGIDKYFKRFPDGGYWEGKNYVFDKRFAHAPPKLENGRGGGGRGREVDEPLGKCEACGKPWDMYRGKRRCPTCGVPSLICRDCSDGTRKSDKSIRCKLCVEENITSKSLLKHREQAELEAFEAKLKQTKTANDRSSSGEEEGIVIEDATKFKACPNPEGITRLFVGNLCVKKVDESTLSKALPGSTHVQWLKDRKTGKFYGSCFVEMATPADAAVAVGRNGMRVYGRPMKVRFQKADGKDVWPPPSAVKIR